MDMTNLPPEQSGQQPEETIFFEEEVVLEEQTVQPEQPTQPQQPVQPRYAPPAYTPPQPKAKKPWNKRIGLAIACAVVVVALLVIIISSGSSSPTLRVMKAMSNTVESIGDGEIVAFSQKVLNGGSISVEMPRDGVIDAINWGDVESLLDNEDDEYTIGTTIYTDLSKQELALLMQADFEEGELNAECYLNRDEFAFSMPGLMEDSYGVNFKKFRDLLSDSVFSPDSDSELAMDEDDYDKVMEILDLLNPDKLEKENKELAAQAEKTLQKFAKELAKQLDGYMEKQNDEKLTLVSSDIKTSCLRLKLDGEDLGEILCAMLEWMNESKDVEKLVKMSCETDTMLLLVMSNDYMDDAEDLADAFYDGLEELLDEYEDIADDLEDMEFELCVDFYISKSGNRLVKMDAEIEVDGEEMELSVTAGPSLGELELLSVKFDSDWQSLELKYSVEENTSKQYSAKLRVKESGSTIGEASISWDKKAGDFRLKVEDDYDSFLIKGELLASKKSATFHIRSVTLDDDIYKPNLTIELQTSDKMPGVPKYQELLRLDEDDFEALGEEIIENLEELY